MMKKFYGIVIMILLVHISFAQKVSDPQLIAPANEMDNVMPDVTLNWSAVTGIGEITYHLQIATDDTFNNLVVDQDDIDISGFYNDKLLFGQQYFWRVRAKDDTGNSNWSETYSFTVFSKVTLKDPDGDDEVTLRPILEWDFDVDDTPISGVTHFKVELDTSMSFDSPQLISETVPAELIKKVYVYTPDYLLFGETYHWRVKPVNSNSEGEFDEVFNFETLITVELDEPGNNDDEVEFDIELEWDDLVVNDNENAFPYDIDIYNYTVEISTDDAFTNPVTYVLDSNSVNPNFLKFNTQYFWRVRASHVSDISSWSEVFNFTTVTSVNLDSPENDAFLESNRPVLEWEAIEKVDGYQIAVSENSDLSDPTYYSVENGNLNKFPLPEQESGKDYYWSVRAYKGSDYSLWADAYSYYISGVGINELSLIDNINIYPNPVTDYLNITFNVKQASELSWIITDVLGQNVSEEIVQVHTGLFSKDISVIDLNKGIYFLEITQGKQKKVMKFVVK